MSLQFYLKSSENVESFFSILSIYKVNKNAYFLTYVIFFSKKHIKETVQIKGMQPEERVKSMLDCKLFEKVKSQRGFDQLMKTIVPIEGDMSADNLGISPKDESLIMKSNVGVVIHSAATIKFDEPIKLVSYRQKLERARPGSEVR